MLQILRDRTRGVFIRIVLWSLVAAFVGTIFLVWGLGDNNKREKPVAKVAGIPITSQEYRRYYDSVLRNLREMLGGQDFSAEMIKQFNVEKSAMDSVIMEKLQYIAAQDAGISVTDDELKDYIENNKDFQKDGRFDKALFDAILRSNGLSPRAFERMMRKELTIKKIIKTVSDSVTVTDLEIRDAFVSGNEQVKLGYFAITPESFKSKVRPDDKTLEEYLKKSPARFTVPEERRVERVSANPADLKAGLSVSHEAIESYYDSHQKEYIRTDEEVRARHILILSDEKATPKDEAAAKQKALSILERLKNGADFAELAKKYSGDPGNAKNGGDLGFFPQGRMVPAFEKVAFELPVGKISELVKTSYGFHIIKVEDKRPAGPMKYEEAAEIIKGKLLDEKSRLEAQRILSALSADKSGKPLSELAKENKLSYGISNTKAGALVEKLSGTEPMVRRVFEMKKGDSAGPLEANGSFHIIHLLDVIPPHQPQLAEARKDLEDAYIHEQSEKLAADSAEQTVKKLQGGDTMKNASKEFKAEAKETALLKSNDGVEGIQEGNRLVKAAFALKSGGYDKVNINNTWYVVSLVEKKPANMAELDKQKQQVRASLFVQKGRDAVKAWQNTLRDEADRKGLIKIEKTGEHVSS
ncbi:MAG: SurA N-terminal domain-containing protein [Nitrospinae bacterium]|nr:SurA N-terminal domain-containing protein [Nitrospinota bacterium]